MSIEQMIENGKKKLEEKRTAQAKLEAANEADAARAEAERERIAIEIAMREMEIPSEFAGLMKAEVLRSGEYSRDLVVSINVPGCAPIHVEMDYSGYKEIVATGVKSRRWIVARYSKVWNYDGKGQFVFTNSAEHNNNIAVLDTELELALALAAENYKQMLVLEAEIEQEDKVRVKRSAPELESAPTTEDKLLAALRELIAENAHAGMEA